MLDALCWTQWRLCSAPTSCFRALAWHVGRQAKCTPGHPWHTVLETSGAMGGTVSVWIGLENTNVHSALHLVSHSHRFGVSLQEQAQQAEKAYGGATTKDVIAWARAHDARSQVEYVAARDGEAIFFDGRL